MDPRNFWMNRTKRFGKQMKQICFYKIQNGGKSSSAHLIFTINSFVEQVQVNMYTKFQVNRSLLKKVIRFLPQGGAREKCIYAKIRNLENIGIFARPDMHLKFDNFWNMKNASKGQHAF